MFTGGQSLYESKRKLHPNVHAFPSSVDVAHFKAGRTQEVPEEIAKLSGPKIGYMGVIDERINVLLIEEVARQRPEWNIVMLGPVVKIDPATLPHLPNIHYLGGRKYEELPRYLASWDIGMLPFAHNEATQYISPTKTPEYLAAGLQVISTAIRDVVKPYGEQKMVAIADDAETFIQAAEAMLEDGQGSAWRQQVDQFLARTSWDKTQAAMDRLMQKELRLELDRLAALRESASEAFQEEIIRAAALPSMGRATAAIPSRLL